MSLSTDFNVSPYYDDYNEAKNFLRVLFRPGYAVQARELTQLQTILQKQHERLGYHVFKEGSKVLGGDIVFNTEAKALRLENNYAGDEITLSTFIGKQIKGLSSGATATVISKEELTSTDPKTLIYRPTTLTDFQDGETIQTVESSPTSADTISVSGASGLADAVKNSSIASISEGVFFVSGFYCFCTSQTIVLEKYSNTPSGRLGLTISEELISSSVDTSILDNAQGALNFAAPGADRFKIGLTLTIKAVSSTDPIVANADEKFISLAVIENGVITSQVKTPLYSELGDILARRTFDESGNYTVRPFGLQIVDHASNTSLVSAGLEAGKAYVRGYEFETIKPTFVDVEKGRNSQNTTNQIIDSNFGNELILKNVTGNFDHDQHKIIDLHCVTSGSINAITSDANSSTYYGTTKVGTARIRSVDWYSFDSLNANQTNFHSKYLTRLYDVRTDNTITGTFDGASDLLNEGRLERYTSSEVSGAYVGALITVNTSFRGVTTSDTVGISDYVVSGGVHNVTFNGNLSQKIQYDSTYTISFDITDVKGVSIIHADDQKAAAANSTHTVKTAMADVSEDSKIGQDPSGETQLLNTDENKLLFRLPSSPAKGIANGVTYVYKRSDLVLANSVGGFNIAISGLGSNYTFPTPAGSYVGEQANKDFIIVVKNAAAGVNDILGRPISNGQILNIDTNLGRSVSLTSQQATIQANTSGSFTCEVLSKVKIQNAVAKSKVITTANVSSIQTYTDIDKGQVHISNPSRSPNGRDQLKICDCFNLVRIIDSQNPNNKVVQSDVDDILTNGKDITANYTLDTGQRDNFYDYSAIQLKPGAAPPSGQLLVFVDRFITQGTDAGYYSLASYPSNVEYNFTSTQTFDYPDIPTYVSPATGDVYDLRDVIDFRPRRADANNGGGANTTDELSTNTATFPSATFGPLGGTADAKSSLILDTLEFYLSRIDKVVLTKDKQFKVIQGIPRVEPITPPDDEDSMTLYILSIPAYTFNNSDIGIRFVDNKRYTMRDIGTLEKRVEKLEYYAALSLLEKDTVTSTVTGENTTDTIFNPKGERFKNGILVDSFSGHSVGDVTLTDYTVAIDFVKGEMRPSFTSKSFDFEVASANSSGFKQTGKVGTLSYTSNPVVRQPMQSNTVQINEHDFPMFDGIGKLYPQMDSWFDTSVKPDVLVNSENQNDHWAYSASYGHGLHWNDWSEIWSGKQINPDPYDSLLKSYRNNASRQGTLVSQSKTRIGIKTEKIPEAIIRNVGNKTVDLSVIPFIRTQTVYFSSAGLMGNGNVYPFFDDTAYQAYTTPSYNLSLSGVNSAANFIMGEELRCGDNTAIVLQVNDTATDNTASLQYMVTYSTGGNDNTAFSGTLTSVESDLAATIDSSTAKAANTQLQTDIHGRTSGKFVIQAGQHRTGERLFRITNSSNNNLTDTKTYSDLNFHAKGLSSSREGGVVSTRPYTVARSEPDNDSVYSSTVTRDTNSVKWVNPLTQTFFVNESNFKNGLFLTSVDLYFETRPTIVDSTTPRSDVRIEIRPIVDRYPSASIVVPFSQVSLQNDQIVEIGSSVVPDVTNSAHATTFDFESPVYLEPGEYALVIKSASSDYKLYSATEGLNHRNSVRRISKPKNLGTLFLPNNSDLWQPILDKFLMVQFNQAQFVTQGYINLKNSKKELTSNTANVEFHTMKLNTNVIDFKDTNITTAFKASNTSGNFDASFNSVDRDQNFTLEGTRFFEYNSTNNRYNQDFEINVAFTSTDTNISPVIDLERFNLATIRNSINNGQLSNSDVVIVNGGSNYNSSVIAVVSGGNASSDATLTLTLTSNSITGAVISSGGNNYITTPTVTISNSSVSNGTDAEIKIRGETDPQGGNLLSKYISRKVTLEDGFDAKDLKVTVNANKPQGTDIKVYTKVISSEDTQTFDEKPYILMTQETPSTVISLNDKDYRDFVFKSANDNLSYVSNESTFNRFKTFAVKIALLSEDSKVVPRVRDMRAIALDE